MQINKSVIHSATKESPLAKGWVLVSTGVIGGRAG